MNTLARLTDKWSVVLVLLLSGGPRRFGELKRLAPGVSQRMLTLTLRKLERDGLVHRTDHGSVPPRVDYELSALGHSLRKPIELLGTWAQVHDEGVELARQSFDLRQPESRLPSRR